MSDIDAVIIASGGVDSTTLLYKAINEGVKVAALSFLYGQKHSREIDSAKLICKEIGIEHRVIDISSLKGLLSGSALTDFSVEIPEVAETEEHYDTLKTTIVPNRNAIFLSIAVGFAVSLGCKTVLFGAHHSDRGVYPDCRREFVEAFEDAERLAVDSEDLRIEAPFVNKDKSEIVSLGSSLGVPFGQTWSCYKGERVHCGACSSCRERRRAFVDAGVMDPTQYQT